MQYKVLNLQKRTDDKLIKILKDVYKYGSADAACKVNKYFGSNFTTYITRIASGKIENASEELVKLAKKYKKDFGIERGPSIKGYSKIHSEHDNKQLSREQAFYNLKQGSQSYQMVMSLPSSQYKYGDKNFFETKGMSWLDSYDWFMYEYEKKDFNKLLDMFYESGLIVECTSPNHYVITVGAGKKIHLKCMNIFEDVYVLNNHTTSWFDTMQGVDTFIDSIKNTFINIKSECMCITLVTSNRIGTDKNYSEKKLTKFFNNYKLNCVRDVTTNKMSMHMFEFSLNKKKLKIAA